MEQVLTDVRTERGRQEAEWGGQYTDDKNTQSDWLRLIEHQIHQARYHKAEFRERMIKIAALAVASVESYDRGQVGSPSHCQ